MIAEDTISFDKQIYYRIIALWVLFEGVLGGVMHGFKIPFTGIIISSGAVICICLIAYYVPAKGAILKATIIVAIFKLMLSPHTPPTAYVAVFFQGMMGQLLFFNRRFFRLSCILLAVLALVESAVQRIVVLTVLYGNNLWSALNDFVKNITNQHTVTDYSMVVATAYIVMHAFIGLIIGVFAGGIVWQSKSWRILHQEYLIMPEDENYIPKLNPVNVGRKKNARYFFIFIWIALIVLFLQSYFHIGRTFLPSQIPLQILFRSVLIILTWYFLISPVLSSLIKKWLNRQQIKSRSDINQVVLMLPSIRYIFFKSWELSASARGWKRISAFCKILLVNILR